MPLINRSNYRRPGLLTERRAHERIVCTVPDGLPPGTSFEVYVDHISGRRVWLRTDAPKAVKLLRGELVDREAARSSPPIEIHPAA